MAPAKDPFAEFKGKQRLTESEVKLLLKRLNDGKIDSHQFRLGGYSLTPDQVEKGRKWLLSRWITPKGVERKNSPFGYREKDVLKHFKALRLADVTDISHYGSSRRFYVPVYEATGAGDGFLYYIAGGEINIVG